MEWTDTIKAPYLMDRTQEVNMYLSSQIVFSCAICSLRTSQSKSCELNNQWLPFWQPQGYLAEDRERESVYVCYEKGKKLSVAFFDPWRQARTEPFSSFTNFFPPLGDNLSLVSGGQMLIERDTRRCSFEKGHCTGK